MVSRVSVKTVAVPTTPVSKAPRIARWAWILVPLLSLGFIAATAILRIQRVRYVSGLAGWSESHGHGSRTAWQPGLIVPGNLNASFEWLDQTRQMLDSGELRVRHVDYENAPFGHDVRAASPYRWWLGLLAWACHEAGGGPVGSSLETAALFADPLLYALMLCSAAGFIAWRFGPAPAGFASAALGALYPFAVGFLPGAPDSQGLALCAVIWSILPLLAGLKSAGHRRLWFLAAGVAGGAGLWVAVPTEITVIAGIGLGALMAAWVSRRGAQAPGQEASQALPWRTWAASGAAMSLAAYMIEYFPSHLGSWDLRAVHPLYGLAWLGWGQLVAAGALILQRGLRALKGRELGLTLLGVLAVAALPVASRLAHTGGFVASDLSTLRLTRLPGGAASNDFLSLLIHEGFSPLVLATILPVLLAIPAFWLMLRRATAAGPRLAVAVATGPVLVALGFALFQLSWWSVFDASLVALVAAVTSELFQENSRRVLRIAWLALVVSAVVPGAVQAWPSAEPGDRNALVEPEVVGLIERDLARWLAAHAETPGAIVLAPANATTALYYYGGLRGIGTLDLENQEGIQAAVRIASATSFDEAQDLVSRRGLSYIVIPSWDTQLDAFARIGLGKLEGSFIHGLHRWALPPWLRPVPYPLPDIGGFEGQSVLVLKVTEDQDDALLMSRIAEYLVETGNLDLAAGADKALRRFQNDLSALVARAQIEIARGETEEFGRTIESLRQRLTGPDERSLPWDRRVSLAVVLAQGRHVDLAREEFRKCLTSVDEGKLRSLTTGSLYHLEILCKVFGEEITDPGLHQLALDLLPQEMANRLEK